MPVVPDKRFQITFQFAGFTLEIWAQDNPPKAYKRFEVPIFTSGNCLCLKVSTPLTVLLRIVLV